MTAHGTGGRPAIFGGSLAGLSMAASALRRRESQGAHWRTDFPARGDATALPGILCLGGVAVIARKAAAPGAWANGSTDASGGLR